jgi:ankyrin repeat protein
MKKDAAFELCQTRNLCSCLDKDAINELDSVTGESPLITLCANGGNIDDIELLVVAGARLDVASSSGKLAVDIASEHGHGRCHLQQLLNSAPKQFVILFPSAKSA